MVRRFEGVDCVRGKEGRPLGEPPQSGRRWGGIRRVRHKISGESHGEGRKRQVELLGGGGDAGPGVLHVGFADVRAGATMKGRIRPHPWVGILREGCRQLPRRSSISTIGKTRCAPPPPEGWAVNKQFEGIRITAKKEGEKQLQAASGRPEGIPLGRWGPHFQRDCELRVVAQRREDGDRMGGHRE